MASLYHIVSVEDDGGIFALIEATLRPLPVQCHHARNGEEALKLIPEVRPDVVVLDLGLPDITGWDLLDRLNALDDCHPDVVLLSALVEGGRPIKFGRDTFDRVITKPFVPAELRHSVSELLGLA
ncbi:MAG TPA: response regulator [Chloroflexota bacterium]|nr:response regulator [Chloroflexota bacterium]